MFLTSPLSIRTVPRWKIFFPPINVWMEYEQAGFCLSLALYGALILNLSIPVPGDCSSTCLTASAFLPHPSRAIQCGALASGLWESGGTGFCSDVPHEAQQHRDGGVGWRGDARWWWFQRFFRFFIPILGKIHAPFWRATSIFFKWVGEKPPTRMGQSLFLPTNPLVG